MNKIYEQIRTEKLKRNAFDLSHDRKFSLNMGELVPIFCEDVVPGDKFQIQTEQLLRMAPMIAPIMHKVDIYIHYFFVPNRILWNNWEDFITGGDDGLSNPTFPYITLDKATTVEGCIADYFGIPPYDGVIDEASDMPVNAMPIAGLAKIWDEYYRDQNLQDKIFVPLEDGSNNTAYKTMLTGKNLKRAWEHDNFTACLPEPQKGPAVLLPLNGTADLEWNPTGVTTDYDKLRNPITGELITAGGVLQGNGAGNFQVDELLAGLDVTGHTKVNLASATATTINDLREAFALQRWLEANARGGSRYIEVIKNHFGVTSSDARLQRPEYLGGGKSNMILSEVLQTSESVETPQGNMAGHGINLGESRPVNQFFEEHGFIIGLMSVMPRTAYQQGLHKKWSKFDKFDYAWQELAHLGEQPTLSGEVMAWQEGAERQEVFGYMPIYQEYKAINSSVHGAMRTSLNYWHMGRYFTERPLLNGSFIECVPDKRIFAVTDPEAETLYCHMFHRVKALRPLPYYGTPI